MTDIARVERWGVLELDFEVPQAEVDGDLQVTFAIGDSVFVSESFVDEAGALRVRFMPGLEGTWTWTAHSDHADLDDRSGEFVCGPAGDGNHGPVQVSDDAHFRYADGTPHHPLGTTATSWYLAEASVRKATLRTLAGGPFTKVRMGAVPGRLGELESAVRDLAELGIEAEVIIFHPYAGGESPASLGEEAWRRYVKELVSRLAAFRNVWWCVVSEPGLGSTPAEGWAEAFRLVEEYDYGRHLRTFHGRSDADFGSPWITHTSVRSDEVRVITPLSRHHGKPVMVDGCGAEGDRPDPASSLTPEELVMKAWEGVCRGGYVSHAESYVTRGLAPWSIHGGELVGESAPRLSYLREVLATAPADLRYNPFYYDASTLEAPGEYYLQYFGPHRFPERRFELPPGDYHVDVIDTWNMTTHTLEGTFSGEFRVELPRQLYYALRIRRADRA
ncbi:DUF5605 domain-containing protein [Actinopolymorpha alba]|uniref:DUF5605 domain-containing protein n=1 Tax=Actinopolymorpha alba TaxID=533267 RepID=UPI0003718B61|nr:DUF5605 domain-containing protein [Actinopolymorpha alba]